jgi:RNA polymerase sigma-70 factor (ECF subfamily)
MNWPDANETEELLQNIRAGGPQAVDRLLARHRESLRRVIALRLDAALARRLDASDVVQDVLVEASRRIPDYLANPVLPFHVWLRCLAKDHIIDAHRRHRQTQRRSLDREQPLRIGMEDDSSMDMALSLVDPQLTPASAALKEEMRRRFLEGLAQLEEDDREIILLRHFEQLSNQETARLLEITEPAAAMRYLRAVRKLRGMLLPDNSSTS